MVTGSSISTVNREMTSEVFDYFRKFIYENSGISLGDDKRYLLEDRLGRLASTLGVRSIHDLYTSLRTSPTEVLKSQIIDSMTTNETLFFRDESPFEYMAKKAFNDLRLEKKDSKDLRIWSAACSTGQEVCSILITLMEHAPDLMNWKLEILATDISDEALHRAKNGVYSDLEIRRGMPAKLLTRYFKQEGNKWAFDQNLLKRVTYKRMNLSEPFYGMGKFDIIFSRYVLIYFDDETKGRIFEKYHKVLSPTGCFFLGASEGIFGVTSLFRRDTFERCVFYRPV